MYDKLVAEAIEARDKAYAPYSKFRVGAALLGSDHKVYKGCNIENASFGATCCAERVAIFKAISGGQREFCAIAIVSDSRDITFPCGICRQVMVEFKIPKIIVGDYNGNYKEYTIEDLMPHAFDERKLEVGN